MHLSSKGFEPTLDISPENRASIDWSGQKPEVVTEGRAPQSFELRNELRSFGENFNKKVDKRSRLGCNPRH